MTTSTAIWTPTEPYRFSDQAKKAKFRNKAAEILMFDLYEELHGLLIWVRDKKGATSTNPMVRHLEWLMTQGETRQTVALCPFCNKNAVAQFSVMWGHGGIPSLGQAYTCCRDQSCENQLELLANRKGYNLHPFHFSSLGIFKVQDDQRRAGAMYRWAYGLEGRLTAEKAFEFFSK